MLYMSKKEIPPQIFIKVTKALQKNQMIEKKKKCTFLKLRNIQTCSPTKKQDCENSYQSLTRWKVIISFLTATRLSRSTFCNKPQVLLHFTYRFRYSGDQCEMVGAPISCSDNPCADAGEGCTDREDDFVCSCPAGEVGETCETAAPPIPCPENRYGDNCDVYCVVRGLLTTMIQHVFLICNIWKNTIKNMPKSIGITDTKICFSKLKFDWLYCQFRAWKMCYSILKPYGRIIVLIACRPQYDLRY